MDDKHTLNSNILQTLKRLGWQQLSKNEYQSKRSDRHILTSVLSEHLSKHKVHTQEHTFTLSAENIEQICQELNNSKVKHMGLMAASELNYERFCLGIDVNLQNDPKGKPSTIPLIDWQHLHTNQYHIVEKASFRPHNGTAPCTVDILCFINGIPLIAIFLHQAKVSTAITKALSYQQADAIPELFSFTQLLVCFDEQHGRFAAPHTPAERWYTWREENFISPQDISGTGLYNSRKAALLKVTDAAKDQYYFDLQADEKQSPVAQSLASLVAPLRFLEYMRFFHIFDKKQGKTLARYHQYFSIKALLEYITRFTPCGVRQGGVIWHTSGSDTHHTLMFIIKTLVLHPNLKNCRILVVSEQDNIATHLSKTLLSNFIFNAEKLSEQESKSIHASTGQELIRKIRNNDERIISAKLNKFNIAIRQNEVLSNSADIIILIDDNNAVRLNDKHPIIRKALPKAALIAFSNRPLLACEKRENTFGNIIHAYPSSQAIQDKILCPTYYEQRNDLRTGKNPSALKRIQQLAHTLDISNRQPLVQAIKGHENNAKHRVAWDIATHFHQHYKQQQLGLKAKLTTSTPYDALCYKQLLDDTGLVSSAVLLTPKEYSASKHPGISQQESNDVQNWWQEYIRQKPKPQEQALLEVFTNEDDPDILIVVNKLLHHFDEPRLAVLYLDKTLKEHQVMQAVSQINRLHNDKPYGLVIDYRNTLNTLDNTLQAYQVLESQSAEELKDLAGTITHISKEYKRLSEIQRDLYDMFSLAKNTPPGFTQCRQKLSPRIKDDENGESYDSHQKIREDFYSLVSDFGRCLKLALSSQGYFEDPDYDEERLAQYKSDLHFFSRLRAQARKDAGEELPLAEHKNHIHHLIAQEKQEQNAEPTDRSIFQEQITDIDIKIEQYIQRELIADPYAQQYFRQKLEHCRQDAELFSHSPEQAYLLFTKLEAKIQAKDIVGTPRQLANKYQAIASFGIFRLNFEEHFIQEKLDMFINAAVEIEDIFEKLLNLCTTTPGQLEKTITHLLLPIFHGTLEVGAIERLSMEIAKIVFKVQQALQEG